MRWTLPSRPMTKRSVTLPSRLGRPSAFADTSATPRGCTHSSRRFSDCARKCSFATICQPHTPRDKVLYMTTEEKLEALSGAGLIDAKAAWSEHDVALYRARASASQDCCVGDNGWAR